MRTVKFARAILFMLIYIISLLNEEYKTASLFKGFDGRFLPCGSSTQGTGEPNNGIVDVCKGEGEVDGNIERN